jgi:hypothetical protein
MKVVSGENLDHEAPVSQWYDQMLAGLALEPIEHPDWPIHGISEPGEILYLFSHTKGAFAFPEDPVFQDEVYIIRSEKRFFFFALEGQSVLKWLAYAYLIVEHLNVGEEKKLHLGFM